MTTTYRCDRTEPTIPRTMCEIMRTFDELIHTLDEVNRILTSAHGVSPDQLIAQKQKNKPITENHSPKPIVFRSVFKRFPSEYDEDIRNRQ